MALEIRILADPDEYDAEYDGDSSDGEDQRPVEVRLIARPSADEDPLEDSRFFASGDRGAIVSFVAELLERHAAALPLTGFTSCARCAHVRDPASENEARRPFVCRACQQAASSSGDESEDDAPGAGVEVIFLGTGDAFGSGGKRQAAIFLRAAGCSRGVLLDAGPGCHSALRKEGLSSDDLAAVVLSHFHGDHYGGFPFLELDAHRSGREEPLLVLAPPGASERISALRRCLYEDLPVSFPEDIRELLPGERARLPESAGGGSALPFAADHQPSAWAFSWKLRLGGRTIVYSGDTGWNERLVEEAAGADLLIHECTSLDALPGHTSARELAQAAAKINASRVLLVHTGPDVLASRDLPFERAHDGLRVRV